MKKILLPALALGSLFTSTLAVADESAAAAGGNAVVADSPVIGVTANVSSRLSLYETSTDVRTRFFQQIARLGATMNLGRVNGKILVGFQGNALSSSNQDAAPENQGAVGVREAWVSYSMFKSPGSYDFSAQLGRFFPNGAMAYGADPTTFYWAGAGNFDVVDGLALNLTASVGTLSLTAQGVVSSSMPVYVFTGTDTMTTGTNTVGSGDSSFGSGPNNKHMAYIGSLQLSNKFNDDLSVEAAFAYGGRTEARVGTDPTTASNSVKDYVQANMDYFEGSAGLRYKTLAIGGWYSQLTLSKALSWTPASNNAVEKPPATVNNDPDITKNFQVYGFGVQGDSSLFGVHDVVAKGDAFIWGAGVQFMANTGFDNRAASASATKDQTGNNSTLYSGGVGYQNGMFTTSLNYVHFVSSNNVFQKEDVAAKDDNASRVYLMTSLSL